MAMPDTSVPSTPPLSAVWLPFQTAGDRRAHRVNSNAHQVLDTLRLSILALGAGRERRLIDDILNARSKIVIGKSGGSSTALREADKDFARLYRAKAMQTAIDNIVRTHEKYPYLTEATMRLPGVARARIFHQISAGESPRKHNRLELQSDHDQRVTEQCIAFYHNRTGKLPPPEVICLWLFHDMVEDHGINTKQIADYTHQTVADMVDVVSIPKLEVLKKKFPDLTKKVDLKNRFKAEKIPEYTIYHVILKVFDGLDALESYVSDIQSGRIMITGDRHLADDKGKPPVLFIEDMKNNIAQRQAGHELLKNRCRQIEAMTGAAAQKMNPDPLSCLAMIPYFEKLLGPAEQKLLRTLDEYCFAAAPQMDDVDAPRPDFRRGPVFPNRLAAE